MFEWETASAEIKQQSIEEIEEEFNNVVSNTYAVTAVVHRLPMFFSYYSLKYDKNCVFLQVREYIINLLTFVVLFLFSYVVVASYHQKKERVGLYAEDEDAKAYRFLALQQLLC